MKTLINCSLRNSVFTAYGMDFVLRNPLDSTRIDFVAQNESRSLRAPLHCQEQ